MGGNNNILLSALTLGPATIPMGGEDDVAVFTPDARYTVQQGVNGAIFSKVASPTGTIVITLYATDPANVILRGLVNADNAALGALPLPGTMIDSAGQIVAWTRARITQEAPVRLGTNAATQSWTIVASDYTIVQPPIAVVL